MAPSLAFRDTAAWLAWADDMRGQTGLEILLAIERDAREILDSDPVLRKRVAGEVQEWFRRVRLLKGAASALGDGARARRAAEVSALRKA